MAPSTTGIGYEIILPKRPIREALPNQTSAPKGYKCRPSGILSLESKAFVFGIAFKVLNEETKS
jgi:hypothetical protein